MKNTKIKKEIFKAYDIRGIYPDELNEDVVYRVGRAYADMLKEENSSKDSLIVVVGKDMRISTPKLLPELIKGITEQGVNVVKIGYASTPTMYFATSFFKYDGGVAVTASHNPKEYNGLKLVRAGAVPISGDTGIKDIAKRVENNDFITSSKRGEVTERNDAIDKQIELALNYADIDKIKPLKIVMDTANAMGITYMEKLFAKLPCQLIKINSELDGTFPAHLADPLDDENNQDLQEKVVEEKADLGIAIDGDGDRIFFVDNNGKTIDQSIIRGILSMIFLKDNPGATICYDIRPGRITRDMILKYGGKPSVTKVGHSLIKEQALKEGAVFAGESSGHFFLKMSHGLYEVPMIVTLKLLTEFSQANKSVAEYIKPYDIYYHSGEINSEVEDKEGKMKELAEKYKDAKDISWLDGVTIEYDDFWFNVRPSNTEPLLRLNLEAISKEVMKEKRDEVLKIIRN